MARPLLLIYGARTRFWLDSRLQFLSWNAVAVEIVIDDSNILGTDDKVMGVMR